MRAFYRALCLFLLAPYVAGCLSGYSTDRTKPNVIILFSDDAGYSDFGFQGNGDYLTPNLDGLADQGIRFTNAYVSASVCSPSRAGLMTGRYQQRFGHEYNLPGMEDAEVGPRQRGLPLSEITIADLLRREGYATGIIGKWHLGRHPRFHPSERGFDEFFGMLKGSGPYLPGTANGISSNFKVVDNPSLPYLTDAFGDEAVEFIERHSTEPFFLFLSFNAPHTPLEARPDYLEADRVRFRSEVRATNAAMTRSLDDNVGKVLDRLEDLGLAYNTVVIFTNDNGGAMPYNASNNDPLRGAKGTVLEGGVRVPFVLRWPGALAGHRVYDDAISTLDILPTVVSAAGGSLPENLTLDGVDLLPFLDEHSGAVRGTLRHPHDVLFWKLNWGAAVREGDWKFVRTPGGAEWLFNLHNDISEETDLSAAHPDIAGNLRRKLAGWEASLPPPIWVSDPIWREHSLERYDQDRVRTFVRR